jgi:hypothetical protein
MYRSALRTQHVSDGKPIPQDPEGIHVTRQPGRFAHLPVCPNSSITNPPCPNATLFGTRCSHSTGPPSAQRWTPSAQRRTPSAQHRSALFFWRARGGQAMMSCRSLLTRRHSSNLSESGIRAVQCYDCPTSRGSGHHT